MSKDNPPVIVKIVSPISGDVYAMEIHVDLEEFDRWAQAFHRRDEDNSPLQEAFPDLNAGEREFLFSGISPIEWELMHINQERAERGHSPLQSLFELGDEDCLRENYFVDFSKCWKV